MTALQWIALYICIWMLSGFWVVMFYFLLSSAKDMAKEVVEHYLKSKKALFVQLEEDLGDSKPRKFGNN